MRRAPRALAVPLPLPDRHDAAFIQTDTGRERSETAAFKAWEQACRQKWRALALVIKAKLEAVESGIAIFDEEFLANIVLPDNTTVGKVMLPQINKAYETGKMPPLLPDLTGKE